MNIFEQASRQNLRFESGKGELTTEQLWYLQLTVKGDHPDLDKLARRVNSELKSLEEGSFVNVNPDPRKGTLELKLAILKHIIAEKQAAISAATKRAANAERRKLLQDLLATKDYDALKNLPREDLEKELAALAD